MSITEVPERWQVLKLSHDNKTFYKIFASWAGGFLGSDRFRINSGITQVEEDTDNYYFYGISGSCYQCNKRSYGVVTAYAHGVLNDLLENAYKVDTKVDVMPDDTNWINLNY